MNFSYYVQLLFSSWWIKLNKVLLTYLDIYIGDPDRREYTIMDNKSINAISINLPPFWKNNSAGWLITMQSQFIKTGIINEETKYHHIISSLTDDLTGKVIHILHTLQTATNIHISKVNITTTYKSRKCNTVSTFMWTRWSYWITKPHATI